MAPQKGVILKIEMGKVDNLFAGVVFSMGAEMLRMEVFGDEGLKFPGETVIFPETDFLRIQDMLSNMSIPSVWTGKCNILSSGSRTCCPL